LDISLETTGLGDVATLDQSLLSYYAYRLAGAVVPLLPPRVGYSLFGQLGSLAYRMSTASRENVQDNVRHVLGPQATPQHIARTTRTIFCNQARNYYDLFRVPRLGPEQIENMVTVHGWERLEHALSAGKGVVLVSAHFGNLDVVAQAIALRQYPITVAAEHLRPDKLYRYVVSLRGCKGIHIVPVDAFMRPLFKALHQNEIAALAADRNLSDTGTEIPFFGTPAFLPDGHIRLALHTSAKVVLAFGLRKPDNTFDAFVEPALALENTGDKERDVNLGMMRLVALMEKYIGRYPEQWVMFQPVWRLRPPTVGIFSMRDTSTASETTQ